MVRLYCIKLGQIAIILGGGGQKEKDTRRWQDDAKLTSEMNKMKYFMDKIDERFRDKDLWWNDEDELDGDFIFP